MKTIKIQFSDFWPGFVNTDNFFIHLLSRHFKVELSENPDYLIYSCYGFDHLQYNCYKILYCGENIRVNWNGCDFAMSSDYLDDDRYYRLPHWIFYGDINKLIKDPREAPQQKAEEKRFCSFIVGNPKAKKRIDFFNKLSEYKKVDSGGSFLNNVGKVHAPLEKMDFIKNYKFTIAFENSAYPGYTTEKLFQAMLADTIPVYWGDPLVGKDFNTASFINVSDFKSDAEVINRIIEIDTDHEQYRRMMAEPWYNGNKLPECVREENIVAFFEKIFSTYGKFAPVSKSQKRYLYKAQIFYGKMDYLLNSFLEYKKVFR